MYNSKSKIAEEFIDDEEILKTLAYAKENKNNRKLIRSILDKAAQCKGLTYQEAAVLMECDDKDTLSE